MVASGPAIIEKHADAGESAPSLTKVKDSVPPQTAAVKESTASGLFLPPALGIPTSERGLVSGPTSARPLSAVAAPPKLASPKESVNKLLPTTNQSVAEMQSVKSLSLPAQAIPSTNKVTVAPPKDSGAAKVVATAEVPLLRVRIEEVPRLSSSEGTVSYRLIITNEGSGVARDLTVRSELDGALDYAASDPLPNRQELIAQKQVLTLRLPAIQPGETKVLQFTVRPRRAGSINIASQTKHSVFYRDGKGNLLYTP